jgi:hypothetical protein
LNKSTPLSKASTIASIVPVEPIVTPSFWMRAPGTSISQVILRAV